jgi:RimJ/RimL family protein N-acetyltransferase
MLNPVWTVHTGRLVLSPVQWTDLPDLIALKSDPRVFAIMLGGVRSAERTAQELAEDVRLWGRRGYGMWTVREHGRPTFLGVTGLMERPDGRGTALRFALGPQAQGKGLAREAAAVALRYGHETAGLERIVAVARATNFSSRSVLGDIGMKEAECFQQSGWNMVLYESVRRGSAR